MKKVIITILFISSVVSLTFGIIKYKEYVDKPGDKKNVEEIENKIKEVEVEINNKKEEYNKTKEEKQEELKVVETWQEKIKAIRSYL